MKIMKKKNTVSLHLVSFLLCVCLFVVCVSWSSHLGFVYWSFLFSYGGLIKVYGREGREEGRLTKGGWEVGGSYFFFFSSSFFFIFSLIIMHLCPLLSLLTHVPSSSFPSSTSSSYISSPLSFSTSSLHLLSLLLFFITSLLHLLSLLLPHHVLRVLLCIGKRDDGDNSNDDNDGNDNDGDYDDDGDDGEGDGVIYGVGPSECMC